MEHGKLLKEVIQTPNFRISVCQDREVVEACGALKVVFITIITKLNGFGYWTNLIKNIVAVGCGFCEGLGMGDNTRAAIIRLGLMEICKFCRLLYPSKFEKI